MKSFCGYSNQVDYIWTKNIVVLMLRTSPHVVWFRQGFLSNGTINSLRWMIYCGPCNGHCSMLNSTLGFSNHQMPIIPHSQLWQSKVFPNIPECPWRSKLPQFENRQLLKIISHAMYESRVFKPQLIQLYRKVC